MPVSSSRSFFSTVMAGPAWRRKGQCSGARGLAHRTAPALRHTDACTAGRICAAPCLARAIERAVPGGRALHRGKESHEASPASRGVGRRAVARNTVATQAAHAQACISLNAVDVAAVENFDTLATSGTSNALALTGWQLIRNRQRRPRQRALRRRHRQRQHRRHDTASAAAAAASAPWARLRSGSLIPSLRRLLHQQHRRAHHRAGRRLQRRALAHRHHLAQRPARLPVQPRRDQPGVGTWIDADALDFASHDRAPCTGGHSMATRPGTARRWPAKHRPAVDCRPEPPCGSAGPTWTPAAPMTAWPSTTSS